jgi:anti-repressor protein
MGQLVPVFMHPIGGREVQATNLRELHGNLESGWDFSDWIKNRIEKYGFVEGRDFVTVPETTVTVQNGKTYRSPRIDYYGTLVMGKELAMVENNERGRPCMWPP